MDKPWPSFKQWQLTHAAKHDPMRYDWLILKSAQEQSRAIEKFALQFGFAMDGFQKTVLRTMLVMRQLTTKGESDGLG